MSIQFIHLNKGWNAEPNAPEESIKTFESKLTLEFFVNPWAYEGFEEEQKIKLIFASVSKYRLGETNDEGWYRGECRFKKLAPKWGEFYQLIGEDSDIENADDWIILSQEKELNHYLFYFRDNTFECFAKSYEKSKDS